jgi:Tfp pilus assembly protein PilW
MNMKRTTSMLVSVAAVAALAVIPGTGATAAPVSAASSSAGLTSFHGTVSSVSTGSSTLRLKRASGRIMSFRVTSATTFQRLGGGLSALTRGKSIEVKARQVNGRWTARKIEPATGTDDNGSGSHGADDGPNHDAGDDHGGGRGGHGSDD